MSYYVYILKSDKNFSYIGQTSDLNDRLTRHFNNRSKYTKDKGSWKLIISYEVISRSEAVSLERKLKKMKNVEKAIKYLEKLKQEKEAGSEHPD
ncbi:GIY-YIG nuclease family protein [Melioribacter sp. OK-6-Me]|uniref:GIY-YIG nuclease family protein n=1 Tax=unclassified Melioribacter TaxID=2627329 RepID=UPI003EDB525D